MSKIPKALLVGALVLGSGAELAHASPAHATSQVSCDKGGASLVWRGIEAQARRLFWTLRWRVRRGAGAAGTPCVSVEETVYACTFCTISVTSRNVCRGFATMRPHCRGSKDQKVEAICAQDFSVEPKGTSPSSSQENLLNNGGEKSCTGPLQAFAHSRNLILAVATARTDAGFTRLMNCNQAEVNLMLRYLHARILVRAPAATRHDQDHPDGPFIRGGTDSLAHHNRNRKLATGTMSICIFTHSPSQDQRKRIEDEFSLCRRGKLVSTCPRHNINILGTDSDLSAPSPNTWAVMQNEPPKRLWRIA